MPLHRLELFHRLFQMTATIAMVKQPKRSPRISLSDLVAKLASADHTIAYLMKPLPEPLLDSMRLLAGRRGLGSLDLVVEKIDDVAYLKNCSLAVRQCITALACRRRP